MSLDMHFLPENQRDQEHKERAYGKASAPGGMQIGLCSAFFMIHDSSHGNKLDSGENFRTENVLKNNYFFRKLILLPPVHIRKVLDYSSEKGLIFWKHWRNIRELDKYILRKQK